MQWHVTRENGTEPPFANEYWNTAEDGLYLDIISGELLFTSDDKFQSSCGWPSFTRPARESAVLEKTDYSHNMQRTEVRASRSDSHLGHVFDDGPLPGGLRYCINSAALRFVPASRSVAYLAAGCFWGTEAYFRALAGVLDVTAGYMGGTVEAPTYEQVCSGTTGHAETVRVRFDPERISYRDILRHFFRMHDPTSLDRQGGDVGTQYRSAIFCVDDGQREVSTNLVRELESAGRYADPVVTEIARSAVFYPAEGYHQRYLEQHPGGYCHVNLSLANRPLD